MFRAARGVALCLAQWYNGQESAHLLRQVWKKRTRTRDSRPFVPGQAWQAIGCLLCVWAVNTRLCCRASTRLAGERETEMSRAGGIIQRCRHILESHYGSRFRGLVLYGSVARNQASAESDIDLLVLLNEPFDYFCELRQIVELLYPVQLDSEQLISAKPAAADEFERGGIQLYRNARREGLLL
jgi:predicted nucleotidyltransferase